MSNSSFWPMDRTLSGATTQSQGGPESDGSEVIPCIPQSSRITGASSSDCLVSYIQDIRWKNLLLCRDAVGLFSFDFLFSQNCRMRYENEDEFVQGLLFGIITQKWQYNHYLRIKEEKKTMNDNLQSLENGCSTWTYYDPTNNRSTVL